MQLSGRSDRGSWKCALVVGAALFITGCSTWVCDASTCAEGCCDGAGTCILNGGKSKCGLEGNACSDCDSALACTAGACVCAPGLEFINGGCDCSSRSCPAGCCQGAGTSAAQCVSGVVDWGCGPAGGTCAQCLNATHCTNGSCIVCVSLDDACTPDGGAPCCGSQGASYTLACLKTPGSKEYLCR
jgi:hypothetical protein